MRSLGPTQTLGTRACMFESPGGEKALPSDRGQHLGTFLVVTTGGGDYWHQVAEARDTPHTSAVLRRRRSPGHPGSDRTLL